MKLALVADVHLGNHRRFGGEVESGLNARFRQTLAVLKEAIDEAGRQDCEAFVVLGDLFDTSRPTPQEVAAVMSLMYSRPAMKFHLLLGNHDQVSASPGDHALQPFRCLDNVRVHETPTRVGSTLFVPFRVGAAKDWLPGVMRELCDDQISEVCLHLGIADEETPPFLKGASDSIDSETLLDLMRETGVQSAFAGNWHNARSWGRSYDEEETELHVVQAGALVPTGFDNPGHNYGNMIVCQPGREPHRFKLPGGPRFLSIVYEDTDLKTLALPGHAVYVRARARPRHVKGAQADLKSLLDDGTIAAFEVLPDREAVNATAKIVARTTRNAQSIEEAIAAYVGRTAMPDSVDRKEVLDLVRQYLAKNG